MKYLKYKANQVQEIQQLFTRTFTDSEGEEEGKLIGGLVQNLFDMTDSKNIHVFVATDSEKVVGCIIFTKLTCEDDTRAFLLSPVAVHTAYHEKGIGQSLIRYGLEALGNLEATLAITYGDINFYSKTGFIPIDEGLIEAPLPLSYPVGWLGQSLTDSEIGPVKGKTKCVKALNNPVYW